MFSGSRWCGSPAPHRSTSRWAGLSGWASAPGCSGRWWSHSWSPSWTGPQWLGWWEPGAPCPSCPAETKCHPGSGTAPPSWTDPEHAGRYREKNGFNQFCFSCYEIEFDILINLNSWHAEQFRNTQFFHFIRVITSFNRRPVFFFLQ